MNMLDDGEKRQPPISLESERAVLGAMIMPESAEGVNICAAMLTAEKFYYPSHRLIYEAMMDLYNSNEPIDTVTVGQRLAFKNNVEKAGGLNYLNDLFDSAPLEAHAEFYAKNVDDMYRYRCMIRACHKAIKLCQDGDKGSDNVSEVIDKAEQEIFNAVDHNSKNGFLHMKQIGKKAVENMAVMVDREQDITGIDTGFEALNEMTAGLQGGHLIVIAARPSMGKTAFALNIAENIASLKDSCAAIFSLEMTAEQLFNRLLSSKAQINGKLLRTPGRLKNTQWQAIIQGAANVRNIDLYIDDSPNLTPLELRARARRLKSERPDLAVIFIDYLQLMHAPGYKNNREQEVAYISRSMKALAKDLDIPVVVLAQLNRESEKNMRGGVPEKPKLSQLRESGSIEQDADLVIMLYRKGFYTHDSNDNERADIIINKQRNGPTGDIQLRFIEHLAQFTDAPAEWTEFSN